MKTTLRKSTVVKSFFLLMLFFPFLMVGQGMEDFTNSNATASYTNGSFTGNNGIDWTYVQSRDGDGDANGSGINLPALMLRRASDNSKVTSSAIPGGVGDFSVKLYKGFTGGGNRQVEVFVNGVSQGTSTPFDDFNEHVFTITGINVPGNVIIEVINTTSKQVIVDDISWTGYSGGGGNTAPVITNITQAPIASSVTSSDSVTVYADIIDSDGIASAVLNWGLTSGSLGNAVPMSLLTGNSYSGGIPAQADGTTVYYEITATDSNASPLSTTSAEQSYTVADPLPFSLPYSNAFEFTSDYNDAIAQGFVFTNVSHRTTSGGYLKIDVGGSVVTPTMDFSTLDKVLVNFDLATFGGNTGQQLSVSVSNNGGVTYNPIETYVVPASAVTFETFIDLSALTSTNGKIKFEMTAGTNSIRFSDLVMQEFDGYYYSGGAWVPTDPSGISNFTEDIYVADGVATLTANTQINTLTINTGATLRVEKILTIGGDIVNYGDLIFVSNATGTGELGPLSSTSSIIGSATVQRYMSHNRAYRMVSSAVTTATSIHDNWQEGAISNTDNPNPGYGTHITGTLIDQQNGFDATITGNPSMFLADVANQKFEPISSTDTVTLDAGEPYLLFVRGDRSIDLTNDFSANETVLRAEGTLVYGTQTQNIPATTAAGDFVMFGNPYQSTVDINSVFANSLNIDATQYYIYDPTLGAHGAYVTVSLPAGTNTSIPTSSANQYLQPGQGAQAATLAAGVSSVIFKESDKAPGNQNTTNKGTFNPAEKRLAIQLYTQDHFNNGGPVQDGLLILFADGYNNGVTLEDSRKPMNFFENLGVNNNGTILSIEQRDIPQVGEVIQLFTDGYDSQDYVLRFSVEEMDNTVFYLYDKFNGSSTILVGGDNSYNFSVDANNALSLATDRFEIHSAQRLGTDFNEALGEIAMYPNPLSGNELYILAPALDSQKVDVTISDLRGRIVLSDSLIARSGTITIPVSNDLSTGMYIVSLQFGGEKQNMKLVVK